MAYYQISIGTGLTPTAIELAMVNGTSMWLSVMSSGLVLSVIVGLITGGFLAATRWTAVKPTHRVSVAFLISGAFLTGMPFIVGRVNRPVMSRMPFALYEAPLQYIENRHAIEEERDTYNEISATATANPPDVVVVIGESLRADLLPQNGYHRNTMPLMSSDTSAVSLPNIYSEATFTHASVPVIMTGAPSPEDDMAYSSQSFVTLFKKAGYKTFWLANQELCNSYAYFAHECDSLLLSRNAAKSMYDYDLWQISIFISLLMRILGHLQIPV